MTLLFMKKSPQTILVAVLCVFIWLSECQVITASNEVLLKSGEEQYNLIQTYSQLPKYGSCWKNAINNLNIGCKHLNETIQTNLAILFTNCLLKQISFFNKTNACDSMSEHLNENTSESCLQLIRSNQNFFITFTEFFTHTQSICFFMQNQIWNENTFELINESKQTQKNLLTLINKVINTHENLLNTNENLSSFLNNSVLQINSLFHKLNVETSFQQKALFQLYDRITSIQSYILGKFTLFYSIIFYLFTIFISYIVTSTKRTYSSRSFVFLIQTLMLFTEWCIITYYSSPTSSTSSTSGINELNEYLYDLIWFFRKIYLYLSFLLIMLCSYFYNDINTVNNKLLIDIKNDHVELKNLINDIRTKVPYKYSDLDATLEGEDSDEDSDRSTCSNDTVCTLSSHISDCTFIPDDESLDKYYDRYLDFNTAPKYNLRERKATNYTNTRVDNLENTNDFIRLFKR